MTPEQLKRILAHELDLANQNHSDVLIATSVAQGLLEFIDECTEHRAQQEDERRESEKDNS